MRISAWAGLVALGLLAPGAAGAGEVGAQAWYAGLRAGMVQSGISSQRMTDDLQSRGHAVTATVDEDSAGGMLYLGRHFAPNAALELGFQELGNYDARITGTTTRPFSQLARDIADAQPVSGQAISAAMRARIPLGQRLAFDARFGGFYWASDTDVRTAGGKQSIDQDGIGTLIGLGLDARVAGGVHLGLGWEVWRPDSEGASQLFYGQVEYHFGE